MPRPCSICIHPKRAEIDAALVAGGAYRNVATRFDAGPSSVKRHTEHISLTMAKAEQAREVTEAAHGGTLLEQIAELQGDARRIATAAEKDGDLRTALAGIRELIRIVEILAKIQGEISDATTVTVQVGPLQDFTDDELIALHASASAELERLAASGTFTGLQLGAGAVVDASPVDAPDPHPETGAVPGPGLP